MLEADVEVDRREFAVSVSLRVAPGERLALFGPSGSGKTTTLEALAGLVALRRGRVAVAGRLLAQTAPPRRDVPPWRRRIGLLRQAPGLFPHLSVRQNLLYGAGDDGRAQAPGLARRLEIDGVLDERPARLSGGQAHRVALGRLLLAPCDALLLDEPYAGLDAGLRRALTSAVRELAAARDTPAILVAHELEEAQAFADRIAVLDRGRLLHIGPPADVVLRPATRRVAELVGYRSFVPLTREDPGACAAGDAGPQPGSVAGVHPERVAAGALPGRGPVRAGPVVGARPAGAGWDVEIATPGGPISCRLPDRPPDGGHVVITVTDPPCFGPDGALLPRPERVRQ